MSSPENTWAIEEHLQVIPSEIRADQWEKKF
ncbi:hypothetical protein Goklo_000534 [Gossypium klotzschianum]|uniref:Uncharacterized protein n=1 Tax=Gossypium klotzschianum TaxID=34286 RepID=A0A7J8VXA7_9ROSI|nr:hypothetical protein [Gossypium klotzschianum]